MIYVIFIDLGAVIALIASVLGVVGVTALIGLFLEWIGQHPIGAFVCFAATIVVWSLIFSTFFIKQGKKKVINAFLAHSIGLIPLILITLMYTFPMIMYRNSIFNTALNTIAVTLFASIPYVFFLSSFFAETKAGKIFVRTISFIAQMAVLICYYIFHTSICVVFFDNLGLKAPFIETINSWGW